MVKSKVSVAGTLHRHEVPNWAGNTPHPWFQGDIIQWLLVHLNITQGSSWICFPFL